MSEKTLWMEEIGEVLFIRKPRLKRLRISVKPTGEVVVAIPWLLSFSRGEAFLGEKMSWVIKTRQKLEKRGFKQLQLQDGPLFSTRSWQYRLTPGKTAQVRVQLRQEEKSVEISYPETASLQQPEIQSRIRVALEGVLRYEAKRYLPGRARELAGRLGYSFRTVTIKNNRSNWGSCSGLKNINLNLHLMRLPDRLIDFIVVHELVHTKVPNHGPQFKATLRSHFPDAAELEKAIKQYRPELF